MSVWEAAAAPEQEEASWQDIMPVDTLGRLVDPEQFGAIVLKALPDGSQVRLRDVARIALGAENFIIDNKYNGVPASAIGIQLATGANALDTANAVRAKIAELRPYFPPGLKDVYPNDVTPFIKISMLEVVKTSAKYAWNFTRSRGGTMSPTTAWVVTMRPPPPRPCRPRNAMSWPMLPLRPQSADPIRKSTIPAWSTILRP